MPGCRLACGDQRRLTGNDSALEVVPRRCAIQIYDFTLLYFYHYYYVATLATDEVCFYFILSFCSSSCLSVYVQDYCKSNEPISLKLDGMIEPINRKNWLTFDGNVVPGTHSESLNFRRFSSISHTVNGRSSRHSATWRTPSCRQHIGLHNILGAIRQVSGSEIGLTSKSG